MSMVNYQALVLLSLLVTANGIAVHDFHFRNMDNTVCQSMQYKSPWESPVNVDQYIIKVPYIRKYKMRVPNFLDKNQDFLESIREEVQTSLTTSKGMILFLNGKDIAQTETELFSHFICGYDMENKASTNFVPLAFHVCNRENMDTTRSSKFIRNFIGKIRQQIQEFGNLIDTDISIQKALHAKNCAENPTYCLEKGLLEPLHKIQKPVYRTLIVISGFEDCSYRLEEKSIKTLILNSLHKFPKWIKFLLISKSNYELRKQLQERGFKYRAVKERKQSFWEEDENKKQFDFKFGGYEVLILIFLISVIIEDGRNKVENHVNTNTQFRRINQGTGPTTLHRESYRGNIRNMKFFVMNGADINEINEQVYLTPLHLAAIKNQFHACEWLLLNGADCTAAAHFKSYEHIVSILPNECKIDLADFEGATPLRLAVLFRHELSVHVLSKWPVSKKEIRKCLGLAKHDEEIMKILLSCNSKKNDNKKDETKPSEEIVNFKNDISKKLFKCHSNLNMIQCGNFQPNNAKDNPSMTLYCDTKGTIPLNEHKFPKLLDMKEKSIQIFVKEGYFQLCPGLRNTNSEWNNPLRIGACIGVQGIMASATMGPFIDLPDGSLGFLTCAHLFNNVPVGAIIMQPSHLAFAGWDITESDKVCGILVHKIFDPQRTVSVDVAVVQIKSRIPERGLFAIGCNEELLKAGFDAAPVFDSGSIKEHMTQRDANRPIIKFGSETGLTKGVFTLNGPDVKISQQVGFESPCGNHTLIMKNQYEIQQIGNIPFFKPGDSGSGVFLVDDQRELHCIGMAIGCTSYGSAIVTPIGEILEALALPKRLKRFYHEPMEE
ncbi:hypothetical protein KUTeg_008123 [Tegillarca granosa]|uniref:Uncharacterized protein n=1 Tax=Tegillarca granosa TaxID=220873 RepID=A0ABQ9FB16_TEGGR|nr:hypothetical protein KUTeg_008123 [Tegillarca granosa]